MDKWNELIGDLKSAVCRAEANTLALRNTSRQLDTALEAVQTLTCRQAGDKADPKSEIPAAMVK